MGKYMRKSKKAGEVSPIGVLTRAKSKTLAALQKSSRMVVSPVTGNGGDGESYLELRNRRLIKPFSVLDGKKQKHKDPNLANPNPKGKDCLDAQEMENENSCFGENLLEFEGGKRTTRESTPCSLIRDLETPGSSTRPRRINANEVPNSVRANIPTAHEMDEFFTRAEEQQRRKFIEKYNFDPVKEEPLPGRYEWVKVDC
ncbi:cyclin-dependent kinase inhibitor 4-like [Lycium barbarum]|uniref:cyclin-dependent kinase inhibitor 4-like n=1 Tax=Lycium barbarum TaxID=112863 RepID=UPI00293F1198|nr:cyclin-dependent kinase inhibitor 4-like [Lycium barbarum]